MKSRISIEIDFENNNQPVIQILKSDSEDVRDRLIQNFTEQVGGSSWCQIKWKPIPENGHAQIIHISPINPKQLKEQSEIMLEQFRINEQYETIGYENVVALSTI